MKLYYHKTSGGAEYLCSNFIGYTHRITGKRGKEGVFKGSKYIVRIDGDITKDAELNIADGVDMANVKKTKISKKEAQTKYGIITSGVNSLYSYYLLDNGNVIDSDGDVRYEPTNTACHDPESREKCAVCGYHNPF